MRKTAFLVALALLAVAPAFAQQAGTVTGTATDEQGAVLPGVTVTVQSTALITPRSTTTGAGGSYSHPASRLVTTRSLSPSLVSRRSSRKVSG